MKRFIIALLMLVTIATAALAADARLVYDKSVAVNAYVCDPAKHLGTVTAGKVLKVGSGGDYDISTWLAAGIWPVADGNVTFNAVAAKIVPVNSGQANVIMIHPRNTTQLVLSVDAIICGM